MLVSNKIDWLHNKCQIRRFYPNTNDFSICSDEKPISIGFVLFLFKA